MKISSKALGGNKNIQTEPNKGGAELGGRSRNLDRRLGQEASSLQSLGRNKVTSSTQPET